VNAIPAEFSAFIKTEAKRWGNIIKQTGVRLE